MINMRAQPDLSKKSDTWLNKYRRQEFYIPSQEDPVKTIHCRLIIWQKDDGSGTWDENNPDHIKRLQSMMDYVNVFWANDHIPSDTIPGVTPLGYSNLRFEFEFRFYRNSLMYEHSGKLCYDFNTLNKIATDLDSTNADYLNIHMVGCSCNAGGCTNHLGSYNFSDPTIILNSNHAQETDDWDDARNIAHELGHALGLKHLYNGTGPDEEPCNPANIDFLDDALWPASADCRPDKSCTHCYNKGGGCDPYDKNVANCDNNIMGGALDYKSVSPKQIGRCHRVLATTNMSRYTTGYSRHPWVIDENQVIDFEIKFYQDIRLEPGCTLEVKGIVHMVDGASIEVKPGAVLIVNGGIITNGGGNLNGNHDVWKEIKLMGGKVKLPGESKRIFRMGKFEMKNGGRIEKSCLGVKSYRQR